MFKNEFNKVIGHYFFRNTPSSSSSENLDLFLSREKFQRQRKQKIWNNIIQKKIENCAD